jgi:hypothetical protein
MKSFGLKGTYFSVNDDNAIAFKYFDLRSSAEVSKSEHLPEDGQVRPKHIAIGCDFNVTLN